MDRSHDVRPTASRLAGPFLASWVLAAGLAVPAFGGDEFTRITDLRPGLSDGVPFLTAVVHDDALWFPGFVANNDSRIYRYDGINPPVEQAGTNVLPLSLTRFGDEFVFLGGPLADRELWRWDGVSAPSEAFDLLGSGSSFPEHLTLFGDLICFKATTSAGNEPVCWDGATSPVTHDVRPGANSSQPDHFAVAGAALYFNANDGVVGGEPFSYSGIGSPTLLADIRPGASGSIAQGFITHDGALYFSAVPDSSGKSRLFRKEAAGAPVVDPNGLAIYGDLHSHGDVLFVPGHGEADQTLYLHHFAADGVTALQPSVRYPRSFLPFANALYFVAGENLQDFDIWRWCGAESVELVSDVFASTEDAVTSGITAFDDRIFFSATNDATTGSELWQLRPMTAIFCSGFLGGELDGWSQVEP